MDRKPVFDAVRAILVERTGRGFNEAEVARLDAAFDQGEGKAAPAGPMTVRAALEIVGHEAVVREAYKDSKGIWTWGIGLTSAAGIDPLQYKDKPQSVQFCVEAYIRRLKAKYLPEVLAAFKGRSLTEEQLAAAVSFHWNTGAIGRASWVQLWLGGNVTQARAAFMEWRLPKEVIPRREKERDLFFDGKWSGDGLSVEYQVNKPSYTPKWSSAKKIDIRDAVAFALSNNI